MSKKKNDDFEKGLKEFSKNYNGIIMPRAAYSEMLRNQEKRELAKEGLYRDRYGMLHQRW
jgi:hypothetical protein